MTIDIYAPIIPYKECGGIKLYTNLNEIIGELAPANIKTKDLNDDSIRIDIKDSMMLFFSKKNAKLYKICTQEGYKGNLPNGIKVGMSKQEFCSIDSTLEYDDFEEVWESKLGYFIETDCDTNNARWISIFIKEFLQDDFENYNW
jgi:hypothetical protein